MAHTVKRIARGASTKVNSYAGPAGELVMDTTTNDLVLETGAAGGVRMAKASTAIAATNGLSVTAGGTLGEATTISGVDATTSVKGVVQLSNATTGTSQTAAATEKAVSDALQAAKDYADQAAAGGGNYTGTAPIAVDTTTHVVSIADASTAAKGAVQLSNSTTGTSQTTAATEKAVADALQAAKDYTDLHGTTYTGTAPINVSGSTISVSDATTAAKGVVQVGSNISVSSGTISVASGSTSTAGVVQLNNSTSSTSQTQAATPKAVSDCLAEAKAYADTLTRTVISTWQSGDDWCRIWSDGWCEQGGTASTTASSVTQTTFSLHVAMANNTYTGLVSLSTTGNPTTSSTAFGAGRCTMANKTTTSFSYPMGSGDASLRSFSWIVMGHKA